MLVPDQCWHWNKSLYGILDDTRGTALPPILKTQGWPGSVSSGYGWLEQAGLVGWAVRGVGRGVSGHGKLDQAQKEGGIGEAFWYNEGLFP